MSGQQCIMGLTDDIGITCLAEQQVVHSLEHHRITWETNPCKVHPHALYERSLFPSADIGDLGIVRSETHFGYKVTFLSELGDQYILAS